MWQLWKSAPHTQSRFGDVVLVAFLLAQVLDGALTYLGVITFGSTAEGNPVILWLMGTMGEGPGLASAKFVAGSCGVVLHLGAVHRLVAFLTGLYLVFAILPWTTFLFLI